MYGTSSMQGKIFPGVSLRSSPQNDVLTVILTHSPEDLNPGGILSSRERACLLLSDPSSRGGLKSLKGISE